MLSQRPYPEPAPRSFAHWCHDLGLTVEGKFPSSDTILNFDAFCSLPNVRLIKTEDSELYGFWRQYGDVWSESRTIQEWLDDYNWEVINPTEEDAKDLSLFLGYDEVWEWGSGKIAVREKAETGIFNSIKKLLLSQ
ncbi:hypothetical protein Q5H93_13325 [Hymenobacter sp. ASUV-10]|uniref:Uncharacterized protein n=1 Tax=Hymenobacter aranciens TaxID=3063996 RepID=A0ABT9BBS0_9BACT|nr:hypothetical protein [Hymenobacter sp. ASUV-10]MDO7875720.1 hypothetical protein [Hymenobacter sp. ASUV-10]